MLDISPRQATTMIAGVGRENDDHLTFHVGTSGGRPSSSVGDASSSKDLTSATQLKQRSYPLKMNGLGLWRFIFQQLKAKA